MVEVASWQVVNTAGGHNKYYRAYIGHDRVVYQWGRIGTAAGPIRTELGPSIYATAGAAAATLNAKIRKGYRPDGGCYRLEVDAGNWGPYPTNDVSRPLAAAYTAARDGGHTWNARLADGVAHIVAVSGRQSATRDILAAAISAADAVTSFAHESAILALLPADRCRAMATADGHCGPVFITDLGPAAGTDTPAVLDAALRLWTPFDAGPNASLTDCLHVARLVFTDPAGLYR